MSERMIKTVLICLLNVGFICLSARAQVPAKTDHSTDPAAENMLVYQRSVGGWPKAVGKVVTDNLYNKVLSDAEKSLIRADSMHNDATIDNKATSKELRYLVTAYQHTQNPAYLKAVEKGVNYLLNAQYNNGGWAQYHPDHSLYRGQITYNDNAMINVLNIMQDIAEGKNNFDQLPAAFRPKAENAVRKGISCILKTQVRVNGKLTVWAAQYDEHTLKPAKARAFELASLSAMESVGIAEFLMRIKNPGAEIKDALSAAMAWFERSKITDHDFVFIEDAKQPKGKDRIFIEKPGSTLWARFYDIDTNEPIFVGRDSKPKKTVAEIEQERRIGYAWYGNWASNLLQKKYPSWLKSH